MHYVYFLFREGSNELLYIGRSTNPRARRVAFQRREGIRVEFGDHLQFSRLWDASMAERQAIAHHAPPYNKLNISSRGFLGAHHSEEARARISAGNKAWERTPEFRRKLSEACKGRLATSGFSGRQHTDVAKQKLSGRVISAETRQRMSEAQRRRQEKVRCSSQHS